MNAPKSAPVSDHHLLELQHSNKRRSLLSRMRENSVATR